VKTAKAFTESHNNRAIILLIFNNETEIFIKFATGSVRHFFQFFTNIDICFSMNLGFTLLKDTYSIYRFDAGSPFPYWLDNSDFYSVTKTHDELSVVSKQVEIKHDDRIRADRNWRIIKINGPLQLSQVGIIADISELLKRNEIPIFEISTFDTDYILIRADDLEKAVKALADAGNIISRE